MSLLRNSFTFGFELEAFGKTSKFSDVFDKDSYEDNYDSYDDMPCNYINDYSDDLSAFYDGITNYIKYNYNMNGCTHYDGSVKNYKDGYTAFEWSSPVYNFTTSNLLRVKRFLSNLDKEDIHINGTCGFHTHFSYAGICEKDVIWILTYIALNEDAFNTFTEFEYDKKVDGELFSEHVKVDFYNERYADKVYLEKIREFFLNKDFESLSSIFSDYKYRVLRIHPQGTMEWRGPREFLYSKNGVKTYIDTLYKVVDTFIKALKTKTIGGLTVDEYINNLKLSCIGHNDTDILPDITLKQKRLGSCGLLPWFWDRTHRDTYHIHNKYVNDTVLNGFVDKIIQNPYEINDIKYSDYIRAILRSLNEKNKLHTVIEYNVNNGFRLTNNIQYLMILENITMLPYVEKTLWKYVSKTRLCHILECCKFSEESEYKHKTIDYIITELPNVFSSMDILNILRMLPFTDWIIQYLMKNHKDKLFRIIDTAYNMKGSAITPISYTEDTLKNIKDMLVKYPLGIHFGKVLNYICNDDISIFSNTNYVYRNDLSNQNYTNYPIGDITSVSN